jgi:hypothetical protein
MQGWYSTILHLHLPVKMELSKMNKVVYKMTRWIEG